MLLSENERFFRLAALLHCFQSPFLGTGIYQYNFTLHQSAETLQSAKVTNISIILHHLWWNTRPFHAFFIFPTASQISHLDGG